MRVVTRDVGPPQCSPLRGLRFRPAAVRRLRATAPSIVASAQLPRLCRPRLVAKRAPPAYAVLQESAVLQERRIRDPEAPWRPALVFSPGGFLVSYYLGVLECLANIGLLEASTPISGTSAGALAAAFCVSGLSHQDCFEVTQQIQRRLVETGYGRKVISILQQTLQEILPQDVHLRATDRVGIGLTVFTPQMELHGKVLTQFSTREEFINAVAASCYIPYYLGPRLGIEWGDGCIYSDGMPTAFFPEFPPDSPHATKDTLTISAFPRANRSLFDDRSVDISPDRRPKKDIPSVWKTVLNGLIPLKSEEVKIYREQGYADTLLWAEQSPLYTVANN